MVMTRKFAIRVPAVAPIDLPGSRRFTRPETEAERVKFERGKNSASVSDAISVGRIK